MSDAVYTVTHGAPISEWREFLAWAEQQETLPVVLECLVQSAREHDAEERRRDNAEETTQ